MWRADNYDAPTGADAGLPTTPWWSSDLAHQVSVGEDGTTPVNQAAQAWEGWWADIAELGGPSPLIHFQDRGENRIDISRGHPGGLARFLAGSPTLLANLIRDDVARRPATKAALRLLRKLLKNQGIKPTRMVTDRLGSYGAALKLLGIKHLQDVGGRKNNRAECSHVPIRRRERKSQRFRSVMNAQKMLSAYGQIYNLFNHRRHLISRNTLRKFRSQADTEWNLVTAPVCA